MIARKILVLSRTPALVREVQAAAGAGYVVTHHHRASDVEEFVELKGPFDVLVAGSVFDSRSGMDRLRRLRDAHPELPVVLALNVPLHSPLPDIVRVGAADLVELPCDRRHLTAAIRRAVAAGQAAQAARAEADSLLASAGVEGATSMGEVLSVASPSGGCGKTFYSTNLAYFLAHGTGRRVCLVDLDLQFGEVTSALRLRPVYTIVDAVTRAEEEGDELESSVEDFLLAHESGFWVLPAPRHPAEADRIGLHHVTAVVTALRRQFDYVIVDTSAQLSEVTITALEMSTALICMATVDLPSIRNMRVFLDTLERLNISTERVTVVLNKVEADMGIQIEEVDEALHHKVVSVLPYAREVSRSINQGLPVMVSDARSEISQKLAAGMRSRVTGIPEGGPDTFAEEARPGRRPWFKLLRRKEESK